MAEASLEQWLPGVENEMRGYLVGLEATSPVPLGEEVRAWKFLLDVRYQGVWNEVSEALVEWFGSEHPAEGGDG